MDKLDNSNISKHLGQKSDYKSTYDPNLLVREPRQNNRTYLDIEPENLPFLGYDVWNGYEVSALTDTGRPVAAIAKVVYPCDSEFIVESKSMKLYWNSFNMTCMGKTEDDVRNFIEMTATKDLSNYLNTGVKVKLFGPNEVPDLNQRSIYKRYKNLSVVNLEDNCNDNIQFDVYQETPSLLEPTDAVNTSRVVTRYYHSALLKSNCRVTSQPDWGDVFIYMKGNNLPTKESLLRYIVSFRNENHFHEEICECIYERLWSRFSLIELAVTCLYVRRGGWDINPHRCSHEHLMNISLFDVNEMFVKMSRQ